MRGRVTLAAAFTNFSKKIDKKSRTSSKPNRTSNIHLHFQIQVREHECKWNICQCISNTTVRSHVLSETFRTSFEWDLLTQINNVRDKNGLGCCMHLRIILRKLTRHGNPLAWARVEWLQCVALPSSCIYVLRRYEVSSINSKCFAKYRR